MNGLEGRSPRDGGSGRVASWGNSFEQLMSDPRGVSLFGDFLRQEYSEENIEFWRRCQRFKRLKRKEEIRKEAKCIFDKHLSAGASEPVNVDSNARGTAESGLNSGSLEMFLPAQEQIYNLMKFDSYSRFLKSDLFEGWLAIERSGNPLPLFPVKETPKPKRKSIISWYRSKSFKPRFSISGATPRELVSEDYSRLPSAVPDLLKNQLFATPAPVIPSNLPKSKPRPNGVGLNAALNSSRLKMLSQSEASIPRKCTPGPAPISNFGSDNYFSHFIKRTSTLDLSDESQSEAFFRQVMTASQCLPPHSAESQESSPYVSHTFPLKETNKKRAPQSDFCVKDTDFAKTPAQELTRYASRIKFSSCRLSPIRSKSSTSIDSADRLDSARKLKPRTQLEPVRVSVKDETPSRETRKERVPVASCVRQNLSRIPVRRLSAGLAPPLPPKFKRPLPPPPPPAKGKRVVNQVTDPDKWCPIYV